MPPAERTDAELLHACRAGDTDAFEVLYRRHRDWVVALAHRFCGDREDALDVLQDTFSYLLRKLPDLDLRCRLTTFLYPAVKHRALDRVRARRPTEPLGEAVEPTVLPGFPGEVRDWFVGLGPIQQEILGLRFADGLDMAEIAELLGIPLGTAKSRLHNALAKLREKLGTG